jgi:hypothetical protein
MQNKNQTQSGSAGAVNHPQREEWMAYLYGELSRKQKATLTAHLSECAQCRAEVETWQSAMLALDDGKTETFRVRTFLPQPLLKWGIAAAFILAVGFGAGRLASPAAADTASLRASLKSELRAELLAELTKQQDEQFAAFITKSEEKRALDNKTISAAIATLSEELQTVAISTQSGLQHAQQQIVTLASFSEPSDKSQNP